MMSGNLNVLAGVLISLGVIVGVLVSVARVAARITRVHDVILGSEGTPGVIARLAILETRSEQAVANGSMITNVAMRLDGVASTLETDRLAVATRQGGYEEALRKLQHDLTGTRSAMSLMTHLIDKINQDRFLKEQMWSTTLRQQGLITPDPIGTTTPLNINEPPGERQ